MSWTRCNECNGCGWVADRHYRDQCEKCRGSGEIWEGRSNRNTQENDDSYNGIMSQHFNSKE